MVSILYFIICRIKKGTIVDITQYGPYFLILYIVIKDIIPKIFPALLKYKTNIEDKLFDLLKENNRVLDQLSSTLQSVSLTLVQVTQRLSTLEETVKNH